MAYCGYYLNCIIKRLYIFILEVNQREIGDSPLLTKLKQYQLKKFLLNTVYVKVTFLKVAEAELDDAFKYYESVLSGLGFRFLAK